jgi:hypothetical protein
MTPTPEQIAEEEYRAALWRDQQARRVAYQQGLWYALAGSASAHAQLMAAWQPVIDWLAESENPIDPDDDPVDPFGMSGTVNVGL